MARRPHAPPRNGGSVEPRRRDARLTGAARPRGDQGLAARRAAFDILESVRLGAPFDQARDRALEGLEDRDRRLAHELAAGVLRERTGLDGVLAGFVTRGWEEVAPPLKAILRLGAYQLRALDRVPPHAAVASAVDLARAVGGAPAARFVNAVLRRCAAAPSAGAPVRLADRYSHPAWLVERWTARFGPGETERLLAWNNARPALVVQPARADQATLAGRWMAEGLDVRPAPWDAGLVVTGTRPDRLSGFAGGDFVVQDPAQALVARFVQPGPGPVYDACAAPGGKTIAIGRSAGPAGGWVLAGERRRDRAARLATNLRRAGSGRERVILADALHPPVRSAPTVLLDAPCLGTGTFARHPDARWRVTARALARLAAAQEALMRAVGRVVAPGGLLVYATCSLEPEENERQVESFLSERPDFRREPGTSMPAALLSPAGDLVLLPQRHGTDGAFAARLRRRG